MVRGARDAAVPAGGTPAIPGGRRARRPGCPAPKAPDPGLAVGVGWWRRPSISRVLSWTAISLRSAVACGPVAPDSRSGGAGSTSRGLGLLLVGFAVPVALRFPRWALTPPFRPYPGCHHPGRFVFCCTFPSLPPRKPAAFGSHHALRSPDFPRPSRPGYPGGWWTRPSGGAGDF